MSAIKVIGIGGSLAPNSTSLAALKIALQGAKEAGAEIEVCDIRTLSLPLYDPALQNVPPVAREFADTVACANGLIWSSPLYHGTISGAFKNALDWLQLLAQNEPAYLTDKIIGLISTAGGVQGLQAVNTMEFMVRSLRGWAVPMVIPIPRAWQVFNEQGHSTDPQIDQQLRLLGREVHRAAYQFHHEGFCDYMEQSRGAEQG